MAKQKNAMCKRKAEKAKSSVKKTAAIKKKKKKQPEKMTEQSREERLAELRKETELYDEQLRQREIARELHKASRRIQLQSNGFVFIPSDELLVNVYLRYKSKDWPIEFCPIDEVDVYANHPRTLTEKFIPNGGVWYFYTKSRPKENTDIQGVWKFGNMQDVIVNGEKVGVRQDLAFYGKEDKNCNGSFKMIEYQLHPAASDPLFVCKLSVMSVDAVKVV